jgi:hypothetical protein
MRERTLCLSLCSGLLVLSLTSAASADPPAPAAAPADTSGAPAATAPATAAAPPAYSGPVQDVKSKEPDHYSQNSIFVEGLGAAIAYSVNYERMVIDDLGVRIGLSYLSIGAQAGSSSSSATYLFIPITASYVGVRSGKSSLELGGGATLLYVSAAASGAGVATNGSGIVPFGVAMVGYRLQPIGDKAGFMFRVGMSALIAPGLSLSNPDPKAIGVLPWPYLSLGASF